jgi:hypothetical protein
MEKTTGPRRTAAWPASRTGPVLPIAVALVWPLCVVFLTGYLTIQLQLSEINAPLLDFNARPIPLVAGWVPYLVRAAFVLLAVAAILGYRVAARTGAARVLTLVVLTAAVFAGANALRPVPMDGEPQPIALFSLINGATSPFTLALIGAVVAHLVSVRRRSKRATSR